VARSAFAAPFEVFPYSGTSGIVKESMTHTFRAIVFDNTTRNIYYCTTIIHILKGSTYVSYTCDRSKNHKSVLAVSPNVQTSIHAGPLAAVNMSRFWERGKSTAPPAICSFASLRGFEQ